VQQHTGAAFPADPYEQLEIAIRRCSNSWMGKRAIDYRREFRITPAMANGTAVNVVTMVFGNMGNDSATGVGFTRNPATGENQLYGEFLTNAQGEDVVAGIRTPKPIADLANEMPVIFTSSSTCGTGWSAITRSAGLSSSPSSAARSIACRRASGKMNATAMVRTSVEMHEEGILTREQAVTASTRRTSSRCCFPRLDPKHKAATRHRPARLARRCQRPGGVRRRSRRNARKQGTKVILVREETKPEDIHGFFRLAGHPHQPRRQDSHAAVVARGMGKPCVAGAEGIHVDVSARHAFVGDQVIKEGDVITIDGSNGRVYRGEVPTVEADFSPSLVRLLGWATSTRASAYAPMPTRRTTPRAPSATARKVSACAARNACSNAADRLPIVVT